MNQAGHPQTPDSQSHALTKLRVNCRVLLGGPVPLSLRTRATY